MTLFEAVVFFIPAGIGNMVPVFAAKLPVIRKYDAPIDGGKSWRGIRLLGDHKTWRGLCTGIAGGALTAAALHWTGLFDPNIVMTIVIGAALGAGALVGDSIKSFFKRRIGVASGKTWFPFDQIDYIVGGLVFVAPFVRFSVEQMLTILLSYFLLHLLSTTIGYHLRLKNDPI